LATTAESKPRKSGREQNCSDKNRDVTHAEAKFLAANRPRIQSENHTCNELSISPHRMRETFNTTMAGDFWQCRQPARSVIICPIAIAYSLGQIIKSVCVCVCVCPSASTLTVAFLDRFSPKLAQT